MIDRRLFLGALLSAPLAGCQTAQQAQVQTAAHSDPVDGSGWYMGWMDDEPFDVPLVDRSRMSPEFQRQTVAYTGSERPGTIVVDIDDRLLYLVQDGGTAVRYGVGVGRKGVWPDWSPTTTMVSLKPDLPRHMKGGIANPLGARALYLYQDDRDILFRIHGTNEPWSIGDAVSSGCIRMLNEDIHDLYNRVPVGTTVMVRRNGQWRV